MAAMVRILQVVLMTTIIVFAAGAVYFFKNPAPVLAKKTEEKAPRGFFFQSSFDLGEDGVSCMEN